MLEIVKATEDDLLSVCRIHENCIDMLRKSDLIGSTTFLDSRTQDEIAGIIKQGYSILIKLNGIGVGYFLYIEDGIGRLMSKGIVVQDEVSCIGLQRLVHKFVEKQTGKKCVYIVSKYNTRSLKNILALGLQYKEEINKNDSLYE
jgi:hypothetical protein